MPEVSPGWMADGCGDILKSVSSFPINGLRTSAGNHDPAAKFAAAAFGVKLDDSGDDESGCRGGAS